VIGGEDQVLWLVLGCSPPLSESRADTAVDTDTDCEIISWYDDFDRDGYGDPEDLVFACQPPAHGVSSAGDCNDHSSAIHPGVAETCDGRDEDCDAVVDDGLTSFLDSDGDGHGDLSATLVACHLGADVTDDCDDSNAAVNPSEIEVCDGIDNDCDGVIDTDAVDRLSWYADVDGDGWGAGDPLYMQCDPIAGLVTLSGDCDDADAALSPGAEEICDNGIDEDCDGGGCRFDGDVDAETLAEFTILGETEREYLERVGPISTAGRPGLFVANDKHLWLFRSPPVGDVYVSDADADLALDASGASWAWSSLGDLDGDGVTELAGASSSSAVYLLSAAAETGSVADRAMYSLDGASSCSTRARDADGDGVADLAVGSGAADAVWLVPLGGGGSVSDLSFATVASGGDHGFGTALDLGDLDGDGLADVAVGAPYWDEYDTEIWSDGAMFVFLAPFTGALDLGDSDAMDFWADIDRYSFDQVRIVSDVDGDGTDDLLASKYLSWILYDAPSSSGSLSGHASVRELGRNGRLGRCRRGWCRGPDVWRRVLWRGSARGVRPRPERDLRAQRRDHAERAPLFRRRPR
jgi:hypothetical protein